MPGSDGGFFIYNMSEKSLLNQFKTIAVLEGISFLILVFIAMPAKYMMDFPLLVKYFGWAHGVLFILYLWWLIRVTIEYDWSFKQVAIAVLAGLLPFGPFVLKKNI